MVTQAKSNGFRYPYSGPYVSTRTNAILFECLNSIKDNLNKNIVYSLLVRFDQFRQFLGSKKIKYIITFGGISLFSYILYLWVIDPAHKYSEIAPELIAYYVLTSIKKKNEVH